MQSQDDSRPARSLRRLRLQFGLRSLMVVVLLICLALGFYVERVRRQREAVAALREAGAEIAHRESLEDATDFADGIEAPRGFSEWCEWATPQRLRNSLGVDFFRGVQSGKFGFNGADFPSALDRLRDLPGLRRLELHFALDEDLEHVSALGKLTTLRLADSVISDAGLAHVGQLKKMEHLDLQFEKQAISTLGRQPITDAGLAKLANLRRLVYLDLSGSAISGAGLRHLAEMSDLDTLDLRRTMIADDGLESLRSLPKLRVLYLSETAISDKGLRVLGDLASLEIIDINDTLATSDGAAWLERRLSNTNVKFYEHEKDDENDALHRARVLMRAGRWSQAIEALNAANASKLEPVKRMCELARCYAELGRWDEAAQEFCKTLDECTRRGSEFLTHVPSLVWPQICEWPQVFERVAQARQNDVDRWLIPAQRAVVAGQWGSAAADYARAMEREQNPDLRPDVAFEYAVSRLLAEDLPKYRRVCQRLFKGVQRMNASRANDAKSRDPYQESFSRYYRAVAVRLSSIAPDGQPGARRIAEEGSDDLLSLAYYRAAQFEKVLEQTRPTQEGGGVYWFCRAMACQKLGQAVRARECYTQGAHWLERRMKFDRLCGIQRYAGDFLQTEALRREAERLIFDHGADKHF